MNRDIAGVSKIEIERTAGKVKVRVNTAKPGIVIGKGGNLVEVLRAELQKITGKEVAIDIIEVKNPEVNAQLVAENIAGQIEKRVAFRRAMKQAMSRAISDI